jgi:hypothetical protein
VSPRDLATRELLRSVAAVLPPGGDRETILRAEQFLGSSRHDRGHQGVRQLYSELRDIAENAVPEPLIDELFMRADLQVELLELYPCIDSPFIHQDLRLDTWALKDHKVLAAVPSEELQSIASRMTTHVVDDGLDCLRPFLAKLRQELTRREAADKSHPSE